MLPRDARRSWSSRGFSPGLERIAGGAGGWHVPSRPGRHGIGIADAAEGVDQPRQPTEPQAPELARLQATDHALMDPRQRLQLTLGESDAVAATPNEAADQRVTAHRAHIGVLRVERLPRHLPMMTVRPHPGLTRGGVGWRGHVEAPGPASRSIGNRGHTLSPMHVGCIGRSRRCTLDALAGGRQASARFTWLGCDASELHRAGEVCPAPQRRASASRGASVSSMPFVPSSRPSRDGVSPLDA